MSMPWETWGMIGQSHDSHEVERLKRNISGLSSCVDGLRATSEAILQRLEQLEREILKLDGNSA